MFEGVIRMAPAKTKENQIPAKAIKGYSCVLYTEKRVSRPDRSEESA